jgi:Tfp pilus assembly protein PilF
VSINRILLSLLFSSALFGQPPGNETFTLAGEIKCDGAMRFSGLFVELYDARDHRVVDRAEVHGDGSFHLDGARAGGYSIRITEGSGEDPMFEEYRRIDPMSSPIVVQLPARAAPTASGATVSVRQLAHPVPKQAYKAFVEAQRYREPQDATRAIAKLEDAIGIDPEFREAHVSLGATYARAGRAADALAHFQRALEIGPPDAVVYTDLAWANVSLGRYPEAEDNARKALALSGKDARAHMMLGCALAGQANRTAEALDHLQFAAREHPEVLPLMAKIREHMGAGAGAP